MKINKQISIETWKKHQKVILIAGAALVLTLTLAISRAVSPHLSIEAEGGSTTGSAIVGSSSDASGGKYVEFLAGTVPDPTPTPPPTGAGWIIRGIEVYANVLSYWETNVRSAPLDSRSSEFITHWNNVSSNPSVNIVGSTSGAIKSYSFATCYGTSSDPEWTVNVDVPQKKTFKIRCAPNDGSNLTAAAGDGELVMYDIANKQMLELGGSETNCVTSSKICTAKYWNYRDWTETDADAGLDVKYNPSCDLCRGHRGLDSGLFGFRYDEVVAGTVPHLVKMTLPSEANSSEYVFPYVGSETKPGIIPEGMRVRLKQSSYDRLKTEITNTAAKVMLDSLYFYGSITSDSGGNGINMKIENGNGYDWSKLGITNNSLSAVKVTDFEFVKAGWDQR